MRRRRSRFGVLLLALALAVTGCAGLPTAGPVHAGAVVPEDESDTDFVFIPDGPAPGASPEQIVEGFIAAGSGPSSNWATAKEFLSDQLQRQWVPTAGVIVYRAGERTLTEAAPDQFTLTVTPIATVDETGALSGVGGDGEIPLGFRLAKNPDGQWRITEAPDGIVLDMARFRTVFGAYPVTFFDPTWTYLVPDQRWFPRVNAATSITKALVDGGPGAWLDGAVASAFTDAARMAQPAVPVRANTAEVSLEQGALTLDAAVLARMQTQLEESLRPAGIQSVEMLVGDQPVLAEAAPVRLTRVDSRPIVRSVAGFGFLAGETVEPIPGLSEAIMAVDATAIEVDADRTAAAVLDAAGRALEVRADGATLVLDSRPGLLAPSIDPQGYTWSVPRDAPAQVIAYGADGTPHPIAGAWPGASQIASMRVSRDGTRVVAVVHEGTHSALWIAGITRDRDGMPTALGERRVVALLPGAGASLTWLDASTVAVLTVDEQGGPALYEQSVGGFGGALRTPDSVVAIAGGNQPGASRLLDGAGELFLQNGTNWQHLAAGIQVLAVQQGMPR